MNERWKRGIAALMALGLGAGGFFLTHSRNPALKIMGGAAYLSAVFPAVYLIWKLAVDLTWRTEKALFVRSIRDYQAKEEARTADAGSEQSPVKTAPPKEGE